MTDARADTAEDGDRLPWLEAVDEDDAAQGPSPLKLIAAVVIGLVAIGLVVGTLFWLGNRGEGGGETGDPELIAAPDGPYRVAPEDRGGMKAEGEGGSAHAASAGQEPQGNLSMRVPEKAVTPAPKGQPAGQPAQQPGQPAQPKATPPAAPPAASGPSIQLGAFSSQASAENAWRALSGRFRYLAPLTHNVVPVQSGARTLYRLRASGAGSADICRRLEVAGESCTPIG